MPVSLFFSLSEDKKTKIIQAGVAEFAQYGYEGSSTNRIVKSCGISKGSLFKYFKNKEAFYFYLLDACTARFFSDLEEEAAALPTELFERVVAYSAAELGWYMRHPQAYRLILNAFTKNDTEIYQKTIRRYAAAGQNVYEKLLQGADVSRLKGGKEETAAILKWFLEGFKQDFMAGLKNTHPDELPRIKKAYLQRLSAYIGLLKTGLAI